VNAFPAALNRRIPSPAFTTPPAAPDTVDVIFKPSTYEESTRPSNRGAATSNVTVPAGNTSVPPETVAKTPVIPTTEIAGLCVNVNCPPTVTVGAKELIRLNPSPRSVLFPVNVNVPPPLIITSASGEI
jgi:hypothetical protein